MPKQTKLGDDAQIYQPMKVQTEKEKLREMKTLKEKLSYLWEYYKLYAIGAVAVIALIIYIVYVILHPNPADRFYAAIIDNTIDEAIWEEYEADFAEHLELDLEKESIELNPSYYFSGDATYSANMQQAFSTYLGAGEIDVIIAPESTFHNYAYYGTCDKLSEQLPTDVYSSLTDYFYITDTEEDAQKGVYGIYLTDTTLFKDNADNTEPYILGIVPNAKNKENAVEFIRYLFSK
jgi:hypothetical protein